MIEAIEKAEAPPPDGSTAKKTCCVFWRGSRAEYTMAGGGRSMSDSMSLAAKARSEPSAEMPKDSRRLRTQREP